MRRPAWCMALVAALLWHAIAAAGSHASTSHASTSHAPASRASASRAQAGPSSASRAPASRVSLDRGVRSALRASAVPVLLPSALPRKLGFIRSVAVISADRAGYYVGFSPLKHCAGGLRCAIFHVAGFAKTGPVEHQEYDRPLQLADGTRALFRPSDCSGAACTEASLFFARRGVLYELDANAGADDRVVLTDTYRALHIVR
jgi:hypothetical protein